MPLGPFLACVDADFALALFILFVPKDEKRKTVGVLRVSFVQEVLAPLAQMLKRVLTGNVVNQNASIAASIKR